MIKLRGSVTTVENMDVEVTPAQIEAAAKAIFNAKEFILMARQVWLAERHLGTDVKLKKNSFGEYYFAEYEAHGSHYSGYYEVRGAYREGDEIIWEKFEALLESLK